MSVSVSVSMTLTLTLSPPASSRQALLRTALLRWHPDKWAAHVSKIRVEEHSELAKRLGTITQTLVEQKELP